MRRARAWKALVRVVRAGSPFEGAEHLASTYWMGALVPNTFLLGASEEPKHREAYCRTLGMLHAYRRNVIVLRHDDERGFGERRRIDVWWGGLQKNGGLMILLAHLLRTSLGWREARVCVKLVVANEEELDFAEVLT